MGYRNCEHIKITAFFADDGGHDFKSSAMWSWDAYKANFSHAGSLRSWVTLEYAGTGLTWVRTIILPFF